MPQHVNCQSDLRQGFSGENDDSVKDFDLDEEVDSYLNQLEAIPIELFEESHGDISDGTKGVKNVLTETSQPTARNTPKYLKSPTKSENTDSTASISSIIEKTVFSVLQKKRQEKESKLSVAGVNSRQTGSGSNSEDELSSVKCRQLISKTKQKIARIAKVNNRYHNSKEKTSRGKSMSAFVSPGRSINQEEPLEITVPTTYMKRDSKSKTNLQSNKKSKRRREKKKGFYIKNMSDISTNIVNTWEIMQQSRCTTPTQDGIKTDIIPCMETASSVPREKYCDTSNDHDDDLNPVSLDIAKTENNLIKCRRDFTLSPSSMSSSSSSTSLSGRETVVLPLRDPRLPHLKQESRLTSPKKWTANVAQVSSDSLFQSTDAFCMISKREPSPFPISKPLSEILTHAQIVSAVTGNKDGHSLLKVDSSKILLDCKNVYAETDIDSNESGSVLTPKENEQKLLKKSKSKDKDSSTLYYHARKRSHSHSPSPSIRSPFKFGYCKSDCENLESEVEVKRKLCDKTSSPPTMHSVVIPKFSLHKQKPLTPPPPRYSRSEYLSRQLHESKIPPSSVSTRQQTEELGTPAGCRSSTLAKTEIGSSKPKALISDPKFSASMHHTSTFMSHNRSIINYNSLSPLSSCDSYSPARKRPRPRRQSKFGKSQSRSPCRSRRRSRSVSPWRRKYRRSRSRSVFSRRRRSRTRSPRRRRVRSRSPVGIRYLRSRLRSRKSQSPRRGSRKYRRRSSSLSVSPRSPAEKRRRLKEQTETAFSSLIAALNGNRTTATSVSVTQSYNMPVVTTSSSVTSAALPVPQLTQQPVYAPTQGGDIAQARNVYHCPSHCKNIVPSSLPYSTPTYQNSQIYQQQPYQNMYFQDRYPDTASSYIVSTSVHQMYGNYNQMSSSHQEGYYHSAQTNFDHSQLCFPNAFPPPPPPPPLPPPPPPPPPSSPPSYSDTDYHLNLEDEDLPPPFPAEDHPPPPSTLEFAASSDRDLADGNSGHTLPVKNNLKRVGKRNLSPLTTRLQSNLRYLLPEVKRNKPSSDVLKIIDRALQSPAKEDRMSEYPNKRKSAVEIPSKIETYETCKSVVRKLELSSEVVVVENIVSSEQHLVPSINQEQREDKYLQSVQNKSVPSKLITDLEPDLQERRANSLKCSGQSQVLSFASDSLEPTSRHMLKTVPPSVLSCSSIHNKNSPLGESDADCKMCDSTGALPNSRGDESSEIVSKETNEIKTQQIQSSPFSTHLEYKPVVLNLLPRNNISKFSHFQSNESDIKFTSRQTEGSKHEPSTSVQQGRVKNLKQASFNNVHMDKGTVRLQMIGKSLRIQSTNSSDEKFKTASKDIFICESDAFVSEISEADTFISMPRSVSPVLSADYVKNQLSYDDVCQSVPIKVSKTLQDIEANSSVSSITGSYGTVNSADTLIHSTLMEKTDCIASVKSNGNETRPEQLQDSHENASIGEQRVSPDTKSTEVRESCRKSDQGNSGGDCSEIELGNNRQTFPVTGSKKASALLTENSTAVPQVECTEIAGRGNKDKATILYGKGSIVRSAPVSMVGNEKITTVISKTGNKGEDVDEIEGTEFDPEGKNVQASLMVKKGDKEITVSEMKCKGMFQLGGKKRCASLCTGIECTSKDCSEGTVTETGRTEILENTCEIFIKGSTSMTEKGDKEKIISSIVAQMSETMNAEVGTESERTVVAELIGQEKPLLSKAATFVSGENCVQSEGSEKTILSVPVIVSNKTCVPKLRNKEGSTLLPMARTFVAEEDNEEMAVPEIENKESISVLKVETHMHEKECIKLTTLKSEVVSEDIASVVPEVESDEIPASLHEMKCKKVIHLVGEGSEEAEKCVVQTRLPLLKTGCKEESDKQKEKHLLHETAACIRSETTFPLTAVDKSGTAVLVKLKEQDTVIPLPNSLSLVALSNPRNRSSNDVEFPSVQEELMAVSPIQVSGHISENDIIPKKPKFSEKQLSVTSLSEVEVMPHVGPISPSGNKENLPVMSVNSSVLEHPTSSGVNVDNTKSQSLNESSVILNSVPAEKTLGLPVSLDKELDSSQQTDLQRQPQDTPNHCGISVVIKAKDVKTRDTESTIDASTSKLLGSVRGIKSRGNDNVENSVSDKSILVPKSSKKSTLYKSITLKQFQTSESKLSNSEILEDSPSTPVKNCDKLVAHASSKHTKVTSDKTLSNNIKSENVCTYVKSAMPGEPVHRRRSKRGAFKKRNCHMMNDIHQNLCLEASAMLNDPKLKLCAVVKLKRNEGNKESSKSGYSRSLSTVGKDVSTSDNLLPSSETSIPQLFESFSFVKTFSSYHSFEKEKVNDCLSELQSHDSVTNLSEDLLQPQLPSQCTFKNTNQFPKNLSENKVVHELSKFTSNPLESGPLFYSPHLRIPVSSRPLLAPPIDDQISVEECPDIDASQQSKDTEEYKYVLQSSHHSPLIVKEQDIDNLAKHRNALWSWSKNIHQQCWKEVSMNCRRDSLNSEQVNVISSNEILKQTPLDEGANVVNSDSDRKALYQIMKLLNIPKRTVTTQVNLVADVLQGSEDVAVENETENRYIDLVSALERIMLHLSKCENRM